MVDKSPAVIWALIAPGAWAGLGLACSGMSVMRLSRSTMTGSTLFSFPLKLSLEAG